MDYSLIEGYKGEAQWYSHGGHYYVAFRSRGATTSLRCASDRCPVRWTLKNGQAGPVVNDHDHGETSWVANR